MLTAFVLSSFVSGNVWRQVHRLRPSYGGGMASARVIGSGPNGLAGAITLARAGLHVTVFERSERVGGGCSTAETTLAGFQHDLGSSVYPMGKASPFFRSLPEVMPWVEPGAPCAHPLDDGTAVMLEHSVSDTVAGLDAEDRESYRAMMEPLAKGFERMVGDLLGPVLHVPRHPLLMGRFGVSAVLPAATLARNKFKGVRAKALFAGMAAHSVQALESPMSAAVALVLMAAGHASGWPIARGGAQMITQELVRYLEELGGEVVVGREVSDLSGPEYAVTLADVTPRQLLRMDGGVLPGGYRRQLEGFAYGAGAFKVDYALSEAIPWRAKECLRAGTVHVGGTLEEIAASERTFSTDRPFVLLVQPSLFDSTRAPAGKHTAWAYCHVPNGSERDWLGVLEAQIERFAPGFRECVLARSVMAPAALERWDANLVGGDISGGAMTPGQMVFRPTRSLYRTGAKGLYLCGASTPPGGGVHGMAGFHAAELALGELG